MVRLLIEAKSDVNAVSEEFDWRGCGHADAWRAWRQGGVGWVGGLVLGGSSGEWVWAAFFCFIFLGVGNWR